MNIAYCPIILLPRIEDYMSNILGSSIHSMPMLVSHFHLLAIAFLSTLEYDQRQPTPNSPNYGFE
jgi:hypothetical protein